MEHSVVFDQILIQRYDRAGPRYTSYLTAVEFSHAFDAHRYREQVARSNQRGGPLPLYFTELQALAQFITDGLISQIKEFPVGH